MSLPYIQTAKNFDLAKKKIKKQKDYLESHQFTTDEGEIKSLLDYSYSANISKRYYPRILNKVNTFVSVAINKGLTPIFLTVTLDGFFRDMMRGDYTRLTPGMIDKYEKHIPNNNRNGTYWEYIREGAYSDLKIKKSYGKKLTPRDLYKILSHQMHRFVRSKTLQDIRQKYKEDYMMIRVTEPHEDGVPHFHILMYVPESFIPRLYVEFHKFFPAPRNAKKITLKDGKRVAELVFQNHYETQGFQTEIRSPAGYILKYILKSFKNLIEEKELDYLQAWYIFYKIPRIITTHSLISQEVFHHAALLDNDWYYLTNLKLEHEFERDPLFNTFRIADNKRELIYENGYYKLVSNGYVIKEFGVNKTKKMRFTKENPWNLLPSQEQYREYLIHRVNYKYWRLIPKKRYKYKINQSQDFIDIVLPNNSILLYDKKTGKFGKVRDFTSISKLTNLQLLEWFYNYDFDTYGLPKYGYLKKVMMERNLLVKEEFKVQDYNTKFDYLRGDNFVLLDKFYG